MPVAMEPEQVGDAPELNESEVRNSAAGLLGDVAYDLPVEANSWVEAELRYLVDQRPGVISRWLERGDFYEPFIKTELANNGLPTDLYHLAMIESGFVPTARSRAGAVGLWQFMPATGRMEGLRVDDLVDERMDPVRSTAAAAKHLRSLHRRFGGDWALAAAAYNAGSGRISRGMQGFGANNFWDLAVWGDLADETKHYVPRLYAMTIIARDRPRFGFGQRDAARGGFAYDSVHVDIATPLAELAEIGGVSADDLVRLNPHLLQRITPAGGYWVWVPAGTGPSVYHAFQNSEFRRDGGFASYTVRRGDNLGRIAERSGLSAARVRELNPGTNWDRLAAGQRLRLPAGATRTLAALPPEPAAPKPETRVAAAPAAKAKPAAARPAAKPAAARGASASTHTVKAGETLWAIARTYDVSVEDLQSANGLTGNGIVAGRKLTLPQGAPARVAVNETAPVKSAPAKSAPAKSAPKSSQHVVKAGETLWSIAREYGVTVDSIQSANRIGDNVIVPGQTLTLPR